MKAIITFLLIFCVIVVFHEFGHFFFAKRSGILVREFAIGMGPKIFAHTGKDGTVYTVRILPLGGYVRMAGWGEDTTEIKTGSPASLTIGTDGKVRRINLSNRQVDQTALPMNVTAYDLEDKLTITGLVLDETKTYDVDHDATIVEEDGTELRIAPKDVQYQNASIWGRLITNFAGPMNNFILGVIVFIILAFVQGGVHDTSTNRIQVADGGAAQVAGLKNGDAIEAINKDKVTDWDSLKAALTSNTQKFSKGDSLSVTVKRSSGQEETVSIKPKESQGSYLLGVSPALKTGLKDKIFGGFQMAWEGTTTILVALKGLITHFSLNKLGGPVAMFQMSAQASENGLVDILSLMGMLSINLGIFNLIPSPALDGGKIVMNIIEAIRRKPLNQEIESYITLAGVAVMVVLMIAVTWNDIMRAFF